MCRGTHLHGKRVKKNQEGISIKGMDQAKESSTYANISSDSLERSIKTKNLVP